MKSFNKFFSVLTLLAVSVTACQIADEHLNQDTVLEVTGVIAGDSRVTYEVNGDNTITPSWAEGDAIIGFDDLGQTFTFTVSSISAGIATFDTGEYSPTGSEEKLYAIYAPGVEESEIDTKTLSVNLNAQNGVLDTDAEKTPRTPALMCATATVNGSKVLFTFANQTAIIGVKQFKLNGSTKSHTVTSMTLNGVITTGTFEVVDNKLVLTPGSTAGSITATGSWETDASGVCSTAVYFAAMPTGNADMTLSASTTPGTSFDNLSAISKVDIEAGHYYYMTKKLGSTYVAKTGETTYETIDAAWADANTSAEDVTITLLADCTAGNQLILGNGSGSGEITLDLNGNELTTIGSAHGLSVESGRVLTIDDSGSDGTLKNNANGDYYVIDNNGGTITIKEGKIVSNYRVLHNVTGSVTISGGTLESTAAVNNSYAIYNTAELSISGGSITAKRYPVFNSTDSGHATITGGTFNSTYSSSGGAAVRAYNGTVEISDGYFSMGYSDGELFTVSSGKVYVSGGYFDRPIADTFTRTASDTKYRNALTDDDNYPYKVESSSSGMCYVIIGTTKYIHSNLQSSLSQASKANNDVTIQLRGNHSPSGSYDLTNNNGHTITLDLNGMTLTAKAASFINTSGDLVITDSKTTKKKLTSAYSKIINLTGGGNVSIRDCVIECTASGSSYYADAAIYMNNKDAEMTIQDATIYTTKDLTTISNRAGSLTISTSEISSGTTSNGLVAVANGFTDASTVINSGSFWTSYTTTGTTYRPAVYNGAGATSASKEIGTVTINDGYFYTVQPRDVRSSYSANNGKIKINGGYFAHSTEWTQNPTYGAGLEEIDLGEDTSEQGSYDHQTASIGTLYYRYTVGESASEAAAAASLTEAVASYGAPVSGGVKFLRK